MSSKLMRHNQTPVEKLPKCTSCGNAIPTRLSGTEFCKSCRFRHASTKMEILRDGLKSCVRDLERIKINLDFLQEQVEVQKREKIE